MKPTIAKYLLIVIASVAFAYLMHVPHGAPSDAEKTGPIFIIR